MIATAPAGEVKGGEKQRAETAQTTCRHVTGAATAVGFYITRVIRANLKKQDFFLNSTFKVSVKIHTGRVGLSGAAEGSRSL